MINTDSTTNHNIRLQIIALEEKLLQLKSNDLNKSKEFLPDTQTINFCSQNDVDDLFLDYYHDDRCLQSNQSSIQPAKLLVDMSESTINLGTNEKQVPTFEILQRGKKIKKENTCGHEDKLHYAKQMCRSCYSKYGRIKKPWNCPHQKLYAQGLCQGCYTNTYNRIRREQRDPKAEIEDQG